MTSRAMTYSVGLMFFFLTPTCFSGELPEIDELPVIEGLPDPFLMEDGERVATRAEWMEHRQTLKEMLMFYEYGFPAPPDTVREISASETKVIGDEVGKERLVRLGIGPDDAVKVDVTVYMPNGPGPFPIIINGGTRKVRKEIPPEQFHGILDRGYVIAEYDRKSFAHDYKMQSGVQKIYPGYSWGVISAWAWGMQRVVDYFMTVDYVDKEKIVVTGHSRGGKVALLAGAFDERIALVNANGSGQGGAGSLKFIHPGSETLNDYPANWGCVRLRDFKDNARKLPIDQHMLKALVAPRAYISTDAMGDKWANPKGTQQTHLAAREVYEALGASDMIGIHYRAGGHDHNEEDWAVLVDFADKIFFGKESSRDFNELPYTDLERAHSWTAPRITAESE